MAKHRFGGDWTADKLERVRKYLAAYTKIFARNPRARLLTTIYVDAFAGTGYRSGPDKKGSEKPLFSDLADPDAVAFLKGSAPIALEVEPPFHRYLFIERHTGRAKELEALKDQFPKRAARIEVVQADANSYLKRWCSQTDWSRCRAVVFLDPYGMQVEWSLIESLAATQAIDLWILFPLGAGVMRLLTKDAPPPPEWEKALTRMLGTSDWKDAFYPQRKQATLFGEKDVQEREADFQQIERFFVKRLREVFTAVAKNPLVLRNSKNVPLYLLCFAAGNPKGAPTAVKIADHILGG